MKKIRWFFCEIVKTFSNEKSFLSSKRIERAILFWAAMFIVLNYYRMSYEKLSPSDIVLLTTPLFAMGGFNTIMNAKEKKNEISIVSERNSDAANDPAN